MRQRNPSQQSERLKGTYATRGRPTQRGADHIIKCLAQVRVAPTDGDERREIKLALQASLLFGMSLRRVLALDFRAQTQRFLAERAIDRSLTSDDQVRRFFSTKNKKYFRAVADLINLAGRIVARRADGQLLPNLDRAIARSKCVAYATKLAKRVSNRALGYRDLRRDILRETVCGVQLMEPAELSVAVGAFARYLAVVAMQEAIGLYLSHRKPFSLREVGLSPSDVGNSDDPISDDARRYAVMLVRDVPRWSVDAMAHRLAQLNRTPLQRLIFEAERNFEAAGFYYW